MKRARNLWMWVLIPILISAVTPSYSQGCVEPSGDEGSRVFGFFQPQYDVFFTDPSESSFRFNRMRIGVLGSIPYDFTYYGLLETSPFVNSEGRMFLIDAFITYNRFPNARISVGSFKKPFGAELSMPCSGLYTIERSGFVNELTGPVNRDIGVMLLGGADSTRFEYRLALMNGTGPGNLDSNNFKDIYGRLIFKPLPFIHVGLNAMLGKDPATIDGGPEDERLRLGTDLMLQWRQGFIMGEYIYANDKGSYTTGGGCDGTPVEVVQGSIERGGYYVMSGYRFGNLMPIMKYEQFNKDFESGVVDQQMITWGINYFFNDWTRLQVNYQYKAEDPKEVKNDALLVQVQVKF